MNSRFAIAIGGSVVLALIGASCSKTTDSAQATPAIAAGTGVQAIVDGNAPLSAAAKGDSGRRATAADVEFMTGMISHHAQAVQMAEWAQTHNARADLKRLCERIVVGQGDEIVLMQTWLGEHNAPVPNARDMKMHMTMNGQTHDMLMPGMLTDEEMKALDKARGPEFDRLFLKGMIQHHVGAITMVNKLFASNAAAQDEIVFKFANDVFADQTTEIDVMTQMLATNDKAGGGKSQ